MSQQRYAVVFDRSACTGHGRCYSLSSTLFDSDDQGFGVVVAAVIGEDRLAEAQTAERACPERAITVSPVAEAGRDDI